MSSADNVVTVLLAAPCDARDALRTALEATKQALVEVDPLTSDAASVLKHAPTNVVVLLDGNTEDALDKFDSVLADPSIRLLFEEASVVTSRQGWDSARWSRHLAAKLIGSDDVLPQGVGDDQGFVAPKPRDAVRKAGAESRDGSAAEDGEPERWPEQHNPEADALPEPSRMAIDHAEAADHGEAPVDDVAPVIVEAAPEIEEPIVFAPDSLAAFESVPDIEPPAATAAADGQVPGAADASWQMFQAYDVDDAWKPSQEVPSATHLDLDALIASAATAEDRSHRQKSCRRSCLRKSKKRLLPQANSVFKPVFRRRRCSPRKPWRHRRNRMICPTKARPFALRM